MHMKKEKWLLIKLLKFQPTARNVITLFATARKVIFMGCIEGGHDNGLQNLLNFCTEVDITSLDSEFLLLENMKPISTEIYKQLLTNCSSVKKICRVLARTTFLILQKLATKKLLER